MLRLTTFVLSALPFVAAHHAINYAISGSIGPANANPEFFRYPDSPFHAGNMTGGWNHPSFGRGVVYALELLGGKKGFLLYSPPLLTALLAGGWLLLRRRPERATLVALAVWCIGTWLIYAATSRNMSGNCLSIRWFVPLMAPGMVALAVVLRDVAFLRKPVLVAIVGGLLLNLELVWRGPWSASLPLSALPIIGVALAASSGIFVRTPEVRGALACLAATILRQRPAARVGPARVLSFRVRILDTFRANAARADLESSGQPSLTHRIPTSPTVETLANRGVSH